MVSEYSSTCHLEVCGQKIEQPSERRSLRTRNQWQRVRRTIKRGETPNAELVFTRHRRLESCDHEYETHNSIGLFHVSQTRPIKQTKLNNARWMFFKSFIELSARNRSLKWCVGGYREDDDGNLILDDYGQQIWDSSIDKQGWRVFRKPVGMAEAVAHEMGKERYGTFGAEGSFHLLIDLDLHKQRRDLFLTRLHALVNEFHGKWRCHFQVSDTNAGGIHLILFFGRASSLESRKRWLLNRFVEIDKKYDGVNFTKVGRRGVAFNIEVYPHTNKGCRLPLCSGRTMLLDKPLPVVSRGKSLAQDVVGYIDWLGDPNRSFMPKEDVLQFVTERLDWSCASDDEIRKTQESETRKSGVSKKRDVFNSNGSLKGKARGQLIGFWRDGDASGFQHMNAAILVTLRFLHAEGLNEENAVSVVNDYVDDLPNQEISSRQGNRVAEIHSVVARCAKGIWTATASNSLLASVAHWRGTGFLVSDKSTWSATTGKRTIVDCCEIEFDENERKLLISEMVPLLVGAKQALKPEKQAEVIRAVAYFLRFVKCHTGEIDMRWLPEILNEFSLKLKTVQKQCNFFRFLKEWEWICVVEQPIPRRFSNRPAGKATVYGIGPAMAKKFGISPPPSSPSKNEQQINMLSSTFCEIDEDALGIRPLDSQLASANAHSGIDT